MYKFRNAPERDNETGGTYWLMSVGTESDENFALVLGKAMTLFDQPIELTDDYECLYSYCIEAEDESGEKFLLTLYHGPSGAAIGGHDKKSQMKAAQELAELVLAAQPTDYEHECVYEDVPVRIKYIVKDGKAAVESEMLDEDDFLDEEEYE